MAQAGRHTMNERGTQISPRSGLATSTQVKDAQSNFGRLITALALELARQDHAEEER